MPGESPTVWWIWIGEKAGVHVAVALIVVSVIICWEDWEDVRKCPDITGAPPAAVLSATTMKIRIISTCSIMDRSTRDRLPASFSTPIRVRRRIPQMRWTL